jgi:hypothetical protein
MREFRTRVHKPAGAVLMDRDALEPDEIRCDGEFIQ